MSLILIQNIELDDFLEWTANSKKINISIVSTVVRKFGWRNFINCYNDVCVRGMGYGFANWESYSDTVSFYSENRPEIHSAIEILALESDKEETALDWLFSCGILDGIRKKETAIKYLYQTNDKKSKNYKEFANGMAWIVAEMTCIFFDEYLSDNHIFFESTDSKENVSI